MRRWHTPLRRSLGLLLQLLGCSCWCLLLLLRLLLSGHRSLLGSCRSCGLLLLLCRWLLLHVLCSRLLLLIGGLLVWF